MLAALIPSVTVAGNNAIWTSTSTGTTVNLNTYANKTDVYLNGGPQNCGTGGLPDGTYYFRVTNPSGSVDLSADPLADREVQVTNGYISGVAGSGDHALGSSPCPGAVSVQMAPFYDSPNSGGEYSVALQSTADYAIDGWQGAANDNFKVQNANTISIAKSNDSNPNGVLPGTSVDFTLTLTVTNGPIQTVVVQDTLPSGLSNPTSISDGGTASGQVISWTLSNVPDGVTTLTYSATVALGTAPGTLTNHAAITTGPCGSSCSASSIVLVIAPPAQLTVIKHVVGGTASASDFTMNVTGTNVSNPSFPGAESPGTTVTLDAGSFSVGESGGPANYVESASADCSGTIASGASETCTITNTYQPEVAYLTVTKVVDNNHGGTAVASDWTLYVDTTPVTSGQSNNVAPGTYTVSEANGPTGYQQDSIVCVVNDGSPTGDTVTLANGDHASCTITNSDIAPQLTVIKHVVGGTASASDFTMNVTGTNVSNPSFPGAESPGTTVTLDAGSFSVSEASGGPANYLATQSGDCSGTINVGDTLTCTITNTYQPAHLTVTKVVNNTHGGTAVASDWTLLVGTTPVTSGQSNAFAPGTYTVSEANGPSGYQQDSIVCTNGQTTTSDGSVTLASGDNATCIITNSDIAPQLTVIKHVVNTAGGSAIASDFTMQVTGTNVSDASFAGAEAPGTTVTLDAGSFSVGEASGGPANYLATQSGDCSGAINVGDNLTCTITNTYSVTPTPAISVTKLPATQSVVSGGTANWTITVTNTGNVPLTNVHVADAVALDCVQSFTGTLAPLASEAAYMCSLDNVTQDFTNTAIAYGTYGETTVHNSAMADVTVTAAPAPAISVTKLPATQSVVSGGTATWSITVTNTGNVALTNVNVADVVAPDCVQTFAGTLAPGASETAYTCSLANVTAGFTNTATATGYYGDGQSVTDEASADVVVTSPACTNCGPVLTPAMTVTKFVSLSQVGPFTQHSVTTTVGNTVWYQVTLKNTGNEALTGVTLSDSLGLPSSCPTVPTSLNVGASYTCTYSRVAVLGSTTNTATATSTQTGSTKDSATVIGTAAPTPKPTGAVAGATGTPSLPPTTSLPGQGGGPNGTILLLLGALGAASLALISLTLLRERLLDSVDR